MTKAARIVLADCRIALEFLEEEVELEKWRIHWIGAMALIRAVGHVLIKVDGKNKDIYQVANRKYELWKLNDEIFYSFIEKERNNILKEYEIGFESIEKVPVVLENGYIYFLDENIYRPMKADFMHNEDARDVYKAAIDWWEYQLNEIDTDLNNI